MDDLSKFFSLSNCLMKCDIVCKSIARLLVLIEKCNSLFCDHCACSSDSAILALIIYYMVPVQSDGFNHIGKQKNAAHLPRSLSSNFFKANILPDDRNVSCTVKSEFVAAATNIFQDL